MGSGLCRLVSRARAISEVARQRGAVHEHFQVGLVRDGIHEPGAGASSPSTASRKKQDCYKTQNAGTPRRQAQDSAHEVTPLAAKVWRYNGKDRLMRALQWEVAGPA